MPYSGGLYDVKVLLQGFLDDQQIGGALGERFAVKVDVAPVAYYEQCSTFCHALVYQTDFIIKAGMAVNDVGGLLW